MDLHPPEGRPGPAPAMDGRVSRSWAWWWRANGPEASLGADVHPRGPDGASPPRLWASRTTGAPHAIETMEGIRPGWWWRDRPQPELPVGRACWAASSTPWSSLAEGPPLRGPTGSRQGRAAQPMQRRRTTEPLATGVRAIDGLLTLGKGQRIGISPVRRGQVHPAGHDGPQYFGGSERHQCWRASGRRTPGIIDNDLGEEGLRRSVVWWPPATSPPHPPALRLADGRWRNTSWSAGGTSFDDGQRQPACHGQRKWACPPASPLSGATRPRCSPCLARLMERGRRT